LAGRLGFPPKRRLRKRRQFLAVAAGGRRLGGRHFLFFVQRRDSGTSSVAGETRFGITVTRKIGNAVIRNRVKRIVREGCRRSAELFPAGFDLVIVARQSAATAASREAVAEIAQLARRLASELGR
jgi:ribonuclease P protein component